MFKRLKEKITEDVMQSPIRLPTSVQRLGQYSPFKDNGSKKAEDESADPAPSTSGGAQNLIDLQDGSPATFNQSETAVQFSITEDDGALVSPTTTSPNSQTPDFETVDLGDKDSSQAPLSASSNNSQQPFFPTYSPVQSKYNIQSDLESASEVEDSGLNLEAVSKEQLFAALQKTRVRYLRYKTRCGEAVRAYREQLGEKEKIKTILTESQDKALRRISELKEQSQLDRKAKTHLEESFNVMLEEKQELVDVLRTQVRLLKGDVAGTERQEAEGAADVTASSNGETSPRDNAAGVDLQAQVRVYEETIAKLKNLLKNCKETITRNKEVASKLTAENKDLSLKLEQANEMMHSAKNASYERERLPLKELGSMAKTLKQEVMQQKGEFLDLVQLNRAGMQEFMGSLGSLLDRSELENCKILLESTQTELQNCQVELKRCNADLEENRHEFREVSQKNKELENGSRESEEIVKQLRDQTVQLETAIEELRSKQNEIVFDQEKDQMASALAENTANLYALQTAFDLLNAELSKALSENASLKENLESSNAFNNQLTIQVNDLNANHNQQQKELEQIRLKIAIRGDPSNDLSDDVSDLIKELESKQHAEKDRDDALLQVETMKGQLTDRANLIDNLEQKLMSTQAELHSAEIMHVERQNEAEQNNAAKLADYLSQKQKTEVERDEAQLQIETMKGRLAGLESHLENLEQNLKSAQVELSSCETSHLEKQSEDERVAAAKIADHLSEMGKSEVARDEALLQVETMKGRLAGLENHVENLEQNLKSTQAELNSRETMHLQQQSETEQESSARFVNALSEKEQVLGTLRDKMSALQNRLVELEERDLYLSNRLVELTSEGEIKLEKVKQSFAKELEDSKTATNCAYSDLENLKCLSEQSKVASEKMITDFRIKTEQSLHPLRRQLTLLKENLTEQQQEFAKHNKKYCAELMNNVVTMWQAERLQLEEESKKYAEKIHILEKENEANTSDSHNLSGEITALRDIQDELNTQLAIEKQRCAQLESDVLLMTDRLSSSQSEVEQSERYRKESMDKLDSLKLEYTVRFDKINHELEQSLSELASKSDIVKNMEFKLQESESSLAQFQLVAQKISVSGDQRVSELEHQITNLEKERDQMLQQIEERYQTQLNELNHSNSLQIQEVRGLSDQRVSELEHEITILSGERDLILKQGEEQLLTKQRELEQVNAHQMQELKQQFHDQQESLINQQNLKIVELTSEMENHILKNTSLISQLEELHQQIKLHAENSESEKNRCIQQLTSEMETSRNEQISLLAVETAALREERDELERKLHANQDAQKDFEYRLQTLESEHELKAAEIADSVAGKQHAEESLTALQTLLEQQELQMLDLQRRCQTLTLEKDETANQFGSKLSQMEQMLLDVQTSYQTEKDELLTVWQTRLGELEKEKSRLATEILLKNTQIDESLISAQANHVEMQHRIDVLLEEHAQDKADWHQKEAQLMQDIATTVATEEKQSEENADQLAASSSDGEVEHAGKIKQLADEFSLMMAHHEEEARQQLAKAIDDGTSEANLLKREHAKQLQEIGQAMSEKEIQAEKSLEDKENHIQELTRRLTDAIQAHEEMISVLRAEHCNRVDELDRKWKHLLSQEQQRLQNSHEERLNELTQEWELERKFFDGANQESIAQIDVVQEELQQRAHLAATAAESGGQSGELLRRQIVAMKSQMEVENARHDSQVKELHYLLATNNQAVPRGSEGKGESVEIEYLKNILYEYMMGKETLTLAKVIAAVVRFSDEQTRRVLDREENRMNGGVSGQLVNLLK